jgi:hypothetical protein
MSPRKGEVRYSAAYNGVRVCEAEEKIMEQCNTGPRRLSRTIGSLIVAVGMILVTNVSLTPRALAQSDDATKILKSMSDYLASQKSLSLTFDTDIEVITPELQKIQFTSSGQVQLSRPDKISASRTGGYSASALVFDGKTVTINNKDAKTFVQVESPGSIDQLIDLLRDKFGVAAPGADLLYSNVFDALMDDVIESKHIGIGVIDGVECEHLAFRGTETDWQIWIESGARPIPRKYVITSKSVAGAPQYTLRIKQWGTDVPADAFAFKPAQGEKKVAMEALEYLDEVPLGSAKKGASK